MMTKKAKNHEQVVAGTAGRNSWKEWAGRSHGTSDFELLDLFRGAQRTFKQKFVWRSPVAGTACPVCYTVPSSRSEWWITSSCGHACCLDCLRGYAASVIRDPEYDGPLKCPVCTQHLRPSDAVKALGNSPDLIALWDAKIRDQLLRALPGYRHCPHCSNQRNKQDEKENSRGATHDNTNTTIQEEINAPILTTGGGGGGFVTPECLAPINKQREAAALSWLENPLMKRHTLTVLFALYIYIYSENHSSSIFVDVINTSIFPAWLLRRIWLLTRQWVALQARKALFEPITVECPCCDKPFLLNAESELGNSVLADEATQKWINSNTRPCPSCSVPISKIDGCNHMSCSHCRAKFCWACLRVNAKCRAFGCMHGAPYGNASPAILGGGEEEGRDEQDMGILDRIGRIESDATNVSITDFVILTSIGIGVCGREDPWVQFVAKMIVSTFCFIFSGGFLSFLLLFFVLCVMFRDTLLRDGRQARQQEWPLNNDHRGGMPLVGMDQINLIMEERMLRQAIRRSLVEQ